MKKMFKRTLTLLLAIVMVFGVAVIAEAAPVVYSVKIQNSNVLFMNGNYTAASFAAKSTDLTLTTDSDGDFLVCFYDTKGKYTRVTLGSQATLILQGSMNSLTIDKNLKKTIKLTLGSTANVKTMSVKGTNPIVVQGKITTLNVSAGASVSVQKGASITSAKLTTNKAKLTAAAGSTVKKVDVVSKSSVSGDGIGTVTVKGSSSGSSSSGSSNSDLTLKTESIDISSSKRLRDLVSSLNSSVKAYNEEGRRVYGTARWVKSSSTLVDETDRYAFIFEPDSSRYDDMRGEIKIIVDGDDDNDDYEDGDLTLKISSIHVSSTNKRLGSLTTKLNSSVKAYDEDGDRVSGEVYWVDSSNTDVRRTGTYSFIFDPDSSRYDDIKGRIKIYVGDDYDDDDDDDYDDDAGYKLYVTSISTSKGTKLSSLESKLERSVKAYDDDDLVRGTTSWVSSSSTKVNSTGTYKFKFRPSSSRYDSLQGEIKIYVNGSSSNSGEDLELDISSITVTTKTKRLGSLSSKLNSSVKAYNEDGDRVEGEAFWVDSSNTDVKKTGSYRFTFIPDSSKYSKVTGTIKIYVDA